MGSALPIVSDCRASCDCTSTVNVSQLIADAVAAAAVHSFANYAAAKAFTGFFANMVVSILGETVLSDGGEGFFFYDSTSVLADDGATILRPNNIAVASAGRLIRIV